MELNSDIMKAVEQLGYRVTVGDVAARSGLNLAQAQQGLLALAADTQAHMQVSSAGDIAYEFSKNFRDILRNKYWQLRFQETWSRIWQVLFYVIRLSFGVVLIASIVIIIAAIFILQTAAQQQEGEGERRQGGGMPNIWISPYWFHGLDLGYGQSRHRPVRRAPGEKMNFLEAIFSFLFGDGDPNADLEDRRWGAIATTIRNQRGAVAAEQITPYLDNAGNRVTTDLEDYMLPVLVRFNGQPQVSPQGDIVYYFPELQVSAAQQSQRTVGTYLKEIRRRFSAASPGQIALAAGLGGVNFVAAIFLGILLQDGALAQIGGFIGFVQAIYGFLWAYGAAFLAVPLIRYLWMQRQNQQIDRRNQQREAQARLLAQAGEGLQQKLQYAQRFASEIIVSRDDLAYTTETDLIDQEQQQKAQLDAEWLKRLNQSNP